MFGRLFRRKKEEPPSPFPQIQELVGTRYRVDSAMPLRDVYLALDPGGTRHRIRVLNGASEENRRRLQREFEHCRSLHHPGLAPLRDIGFGSDSAWFARPEIEGSTLETILDGPPPPVEQVRLWTVSLLDALETLAQHDLCFANWSLNTVLLPPTGGVLTDVGFRESWHANQVVHVGSHHLANFQPWLISPEEVAGAAPSPRQDLYSMASVMYRLLAGQPPYGQTAEPMAYLMKLLTEPVPSLGSVRPDLPAGLVRLLDQLLLREPEKRGEISFAEMRGLLHEKPAPGLSDPAVAQLLEQARAHGVDDGIGEFTLHPEKALEKLRRFQFADSHRFLLPLLAAASGLGSREVHIVTGKELTLRLNCPPVDPGEITEIFQAAATRGRRHPMTHLGLGLAGAFGAGAKRVELWLDAGYIRLAEVASPVLKRKRGRPGLEIRISGVTLADSALKDLRNHLSWFPVPLLWDSHWVSRGDRGNGLFALPEPGDSGAAMFCLEEPSRGLYLRVDGLSYLRRSRLTLPAVTMLLDGPWKLDLSYQGISPDPRIEPWKATAEQQLASHALRAALDGPFHRVNPRATHAILQQVTDQQVRDAACQRIVENAEDIPSDFSYPLFDGDQWQMSDADRLLETACHRVRQRNLPAFSKASRLLSHPRHLKQASIASWEEIGALAAEAYPDRESRYWRLLLHVWIGSRSARPPLEEVPRLLQHLSGVSQPANWDLSVRGRLIEMGREHPAQLAEHADRWLASLPNSFRLSRRWCARPTPTLGEL